MKLEMPENVSFKIHAVPEILVFKFRSILRTSQKGVRKVTKWHFPHFPLEIGSSSFLFL